MKILKNAVLLVSLILSVSSCNMDLAPTTSIVTDTAFETYQDAEKFELGLHTFFRARNYGIYQYSADIQMDGFNASIDYGNRNGPMQRWDFETTDYTVRDLWNGNLKGIFTCNSFLDNISKITDLTDKQKANVEIFKGEAYFYRACYYHNLLRYYAPAYDAATAATTLGIPIVTTVDLTALPNRASVAETYAQINSDIAQAMILLAPKAGVVRSETPTIDAVIALNARVQLFMKNYAQAATLAGELITGGKYALAKTAAEITDEWYLDKGPEDIMQMFCNMTENGNTTGGPFLGYSTSLKVYQPDFIPSQTMIDLYDKTNDIRYNAYFKTLPTVLAGDDRDLVLFNKYAGNPAYEVAPARAYRQKEKIFRIAEMYLIKAEAELAINAEAATVTLNALQAARGAALTPATTETVRTEWLKEMMGEGYRMDCLKRWGLGFSGRVPQVLDAVLNGASYNTISVNADNLRFVWPVPDEQVRLNPNLSQNPGWGQQ